MGHLVSRPAPAKHGCREARSYVSSLSLWDAYQVAVRDVAKALEVCLEHILARDSFRKTWEENPIVCRTRLAHPALACSAPEGAHPSVFLVHGKKIREHALNTREDFRFSEAG